MKPRKNLDGTNTHGIFDDLNELCRVKYNGGFLTHTINKSWVESKDEEAIERLEMDFRKHWGFYPDLPERLK